MASKRRQEIEKLQLESLKRQQKEFERLGFQQRIANYNYDYNSIIQGQTYIDFYGLQTVGGVPEIQENYETGGDGYEGRSESSTNIICQTFTTGSNDIYISSISLYGYDNGAGAPTPRAPYAKIQIQATTAGEPNGSVLATGTNIDFSNSLSWKTSTFTSIKLDASTTYAIVIEVDDPSPATGTCYFRSDGSSPSYAGGSFGTSSDSGSNWNMDTTTDLYFRVSGVTDSGYIIFPASGIASNNNSTAWSVNPAGADEKMVDVDFDFIMQHTIGIKGLALLEIEDTLASVNGYLVCDLVKVDKNKTEDVIASTTAPQDSGVQLLSFYIPDLYIIQEGETLRLNVKMYSSASGSGTWTLNHDGSDLTLHLPAKVTGDID